MVKINENFLTMKKNYLFIDIAKRLKAFTAANPDKPLIRMGIGDVTLPLAPVVVEAIKKAQEELQTAFYAVAERIYKEQGAAAQQAEAAQTDVQGEGTNAAGGSDDNVVDADYTDAN